MRLLFISTAGHFGGTERWASMAIAELAARGHEVWMACPDLPHAGQFIAADRLWHDGPAGGHGEFIVDGENGYVAHFKNPARVEKDLQ